MKRVCGCFAIGLVFAVVAGAQATPAASSRSDVYHVHAAKAAPGKMQELETLYRTPEGDAAGTGHVLLLRHAEGDNWDFLVVRHIGPKATVEVGTGPGPGRELRAWHEDTYAAGPPWAEFVKAMGIGQEGSDDDVFIVGTYRGAPGHRPQLEEALTRLGASSPHPGNWVMLQHLEGAAWDYLVIDRSDSWQALAAEMTDPEAEARQRKAGLTQPAGLELRQHMAAHHDTIAERVETAAPQP